jgi:hypothetical protein
MRLKSLLIISITFISFIWQSAFGQDEIPQTSGLSGFAIAGVSYWNVADNLLIGGPPVVLNEVSEKRIDSIFDSPSSLSSPGVLLGGQIDYTFSSTRTQLFFGNRLEDILRMDVVFGFGVRQEFGNAGIFALSYLMTPADLEFWSDPYIEGEDRAATQLDFPGFRIRWGQMFGTGLELTITDRFYNFKNESSGNWLVGQNRLDPEQQPLLNRSGDVMRFQV